jgi:hypothetical protein
MAQSSRGDAAVLAMHLVPSMLLKSVSPEPLDFRANGIRQLGAADHLGR